MIRIALLRAINVGGRTGAMADLRNLLSNLGFGNPRSLLQSGNLVFDAGPQTSSALERILELKIAQQFNLPTDIFIRSASEWKSIIARNPFREEAKRNPSHLVVTVLKSTPTKRTLDELRSAITGPERVHCHGRQAYIVYPNGIGRSRLTNVFLERKLATRGTARNWNTVMKLAVLTGV